MSTKLPKTVKRRSKRIGRGMGSGKGGHTVGRGMKGQKSRRKVHILFEGLKMKKSFIKRLPFKRGKGKFKSGHGPVLVKLSALNLLPAGTKVTVDSLIEHGIVDKKDALIYGVKVLNDGGKLKRKYEIKVPMSKSVEKLNKVVKKSKSSKKKATNKKTAKKSK